jgi:U3 small nucleolar RNA-associated protein 15
VTYKEHLDSVRHLAISYDLNTFLSASYDSTVKLWDHRSGSASYLTLNHGAPVERAIFLRNSSMVVSAGANYIRVWDVLAGGKILSSASHHLKLITSLLYESSRHRILTGSLDKTVKIMSADTLDLDHSLNYSAPILSLALSPSHDCLAVGMTSGFLDIRHRVAAVAIEAERPPKEKKKIYPNTKDFFLRTGTRHDLPENTEHTLPKLKKLATHDKYLRKFQYTKALDYVLEKGTFQAILAVLEEIRHRDAYDACLGGRNDQTLLPLARFILKHITHPQYAPLISTFCLKFLSVGQYYIGRSSDFDEILLKLSSRLNVELAFQNEARKLLGALNMIMENIN